MAWRGVELTLALDKWDTVWGAMSRGWVGWVAERAHGICTYFPLFCFTACLPEKLINDNCKIVSRDAREIRVKVVEGGLPHISARRSIIFLKVHI